MWTPNLKHMTYRSGRVTGNVNNEMEAVQQLVNLRSLRADDGKFNKKLIDLLPRIPSGKAHSLETVIFETDMSRFPRSAHIYLGELAESRDQLNSRNPSLSKDLKLEIEPRSSGNDRLPFLASVSLTD